MRTIKLLVTFIFLIVVNISFAQGTKYHVDYSEYKGELNEKDLFKKDFGRYDGYEIELYKGEAVNLVAYTKDFQPIIALINSKGEVFQQSAKNDKGFANIVAQIPSDGDWIVYVIGDENTKGNYTLQIAIAEANSLSLPKDSDFCNTIDFLVAHSYAYFFLLENSTPEKQKLVKLNNCVDEFLDEENGVYNAIYYNGDELSKAEVEFRGLKEKINFCLGPNWQSRLSDWQKIENYKEKSVTFTEKTDTKPRYIIVSLYELNNTENKLQGKYRVSIEINRLH